MLYEEHEFSTHNGSPIELFYFQGTYKDYYYTSADIDITIGEDVYKSVVMERSSVKVSTQEDSNITVEVSLPSSIDLVQAYAFQLTPPSLDLIIYRIHRNSNDLVVYWAGTISAITVNGDEASLQAPSIMTTILNGDIPDVYYQTPCNHVLYDERCKVNRDDYVVNTVINITKGRTLIVSDVGGRPDDFFNAGELVLSSGERRTVVSQIGTLIKINYPFSIVKSNVEAELAPGCNLGYDSDCRNKFNNNRNFGGFPFIPSDNPFTDGI